eukprot:388332-Rhodomonas_salina.1
MTFHGGRFNEECPICRKQVSAADAAELGQLAVKANIVSMLVQLRKEELTKFAAAPVEVQETSTLADYDRPRRVDGEGSVPGVASGRLGDGSSHLSAIGVEEFAMRDEQDRLNAAVVAAMESGTAFRPPSGMRLNIVGRSDGLEALNALAGGGNRNPALDDILIQMTEATLL